MYVQHFSCAQTACVALLLQSRKMQALACILQSRVSMPAVAHDARHPPRLQMGHNGHNQHLMPAVVQGCLERS